MAPSEPIRWLVHKALVECLEGINQKSQSPQYFNTIRKVYYDQPDTWDRSMLPALCVYPRPIPYPRALVGGRVIKIEQPFEITAILRDDMADGITLSQRAARIISDIHRAVYTSFNVGLNLGLAQVDRVVFPNGPVASPYLIDQKPAGVEVDYQCLVQYSEMDDNP